MDYKERYRLDLSFRKKVIERIKDYQRRKIYKDSNLGRANLISNNIKSVKSMVINGKEVKLYTVYQVVKESGISVPTLYNWIKKGWAPPPDYVQKGVFRVTNYFSQYYIKAVVGVVKVVKYLRCKTNEKIVKEMFNKFYFKELKNYDGARKI